MADIRMKVCGMRDAENILAVAGLQPDYMGFIFYRGTPRYVGDDFRIPHDMPDTIQRVGVFVKEETPAIIEAVRKFRLNYVQLHGGESPDQCRALKDHGVGVIKVFSVDDDMDFSVTRAFSDVVDFFLFDTKGKFYGGNARRFNWHILDTYDQKVPFFLSGGIGPEHMDEINDLSNLNLAAIDVNSGVEVRPGLKDVGTVSMIKNALNYKKA